MPVLRKLQQQISKALDCQVLDVMTWSQSKANLVLLLQSKDQAFFAKFFVDTPPGYLSADQRYRAEKTILMTPMEVGKPELVFSSDNERLLITKAVKGLGFKHFMDKDRVPYVLERMSKWIAGFHQAKLVNLDPVSNLWLHFKEYPEFRSKPGFDRLKPMLESYPLTELVLCKGDPTASNFKFNRTGTYGLDFEATGIRPMEYDLIGLVEGLSLFTCETIEDMVSVVVDTYHQSRPMPDKNQTKTVVCALVDLNDSALLAA